MAPDRERAERDDDFILLYWVLVSYHCPLGGVGGGEGECGRTLGDEQPQRDGPYVCLCEVSGCTGSGRRGEAYRGYRGSTCRISGRFGQRVQYVFSEK